MVEMRLEKVRGRNARVCDWHVHSMFDACDNGLSTLSYLRLRRGGACDHPVGWIKDHWWSKAYCLLCGHERGRAGSDD